MNITKSLRHLDCTNEGDSCSDCNGSMKNNAEMAHKKTEGTETLSKN